MQSCPEPLPRRTDPVSHASAIPAPERSRTPAADDDHSRVEEVSQWERDTRWGAHLGPWIGTRVEVARLRELVTTKVDAPLERLKVTCVEYLKTVTEIAARCGCNVRRHLSECPACVFLSRRLCRAR